jgi:rhamnogalacturonan endolyase
MYKLPVLLVSGMLAIGSLSVAARAQSAPNPLTINTTTSTCGGQAAGAVWEITNGALDICFYPAHASIIDMYPLGTTDNLVDQTQTGGGVPKGFYMDNAGFGTPAGVPGFQLTNSYLDWWVTYPSNSTNAYTYSAHWIVTPNDPGIHVYFVANHATTDIAGSIGQVQWVFREDLDKFNNLFLANEDLSNPGPVQIGPLPTYAEYFGTISTSGTGAADPGRAVQDATVDLHGYGEGPWADFPPISPGFGREFGDKYDYSGYNYLNLSHGVYGSEYGAWVVFPSNESLVGGPTKQMLLFTGNLDMIEAYSNHLDNNITLNTPTGTSSQRLFGPFYERFNKIGGDIHTPEDMYRDAITAGTIFSNFYYDPVRKNFYDTGNPIVDDIAAFLENTNSPTSLVHRFTHLYDNESTLLSSGYVPSTARGNVAVQIRGIFGPPKTTWAVLSDPGKNFQYTAQGAQYWADISLGGDATFHGVMPGTYRLSVYRLGHWGELRQDDVVVTANQTTIVPTVNFVPERFGTTPPVFTIGTPDRSSHEFLHGHDDQRHDDRQYWGNWNYWADFQTNQGAVVYNATDGPAGSATNDLSKWNYNHWQSFDPGLFGGFYNNADDTTDGYTYIVPSYVASLPGASGKNGVSTKTPPWTINFATPSNVSNYANGYAVLSVSLAATEASYIVTLNGQQLIWSGVNKSDAAVRSGLSGYTQWIAFQWPATALNPAGQNNVITISVSQSQGDMDDALRLELTNTSAAPGMRGWNDYSFVTAGTAVPPNDAVPNP